MSRRRAALKPALGLVLLAAWPAATPVLLAAETATSSARPVNEGERALLRSARVWEARGRGDLARLALEKLLRTRPGDARLMLEIGLLELRSNRMADAQKMIDTLRVQAPGSVHLQDLEAAYRLATRDRLRFASVRRLIETSRFDEALAALQDVFPDGPPRHRLGVDYWRVVADTPGNWERARAGFEALVAAEPDDPRYALALAEHLATRSDTRGRAREMIAALATRDDLSPEQLETAQRRASGPVSTPAEPAREPTPEERARAETLALAERGAQAREQNRLAESLALYEQAAARLPRNETVRAGQARTLIALGRLDEALEAAAAAEGAEAARVQAQALSLRAEQWRTQGRTGDALKDLERAQALVPDDPWARYRLARLYAELGLPAEGRSLMAEGAQRRPGEADAHYAQALYLSAIDADAEALLALAKIPSQDRSTGMRELDARLQLGTAAAQAAALHAEGRPMQAAARLRSSERLAWAEPEAAAAIARAWLAIDRADEATRVIQAARRLRPDSLPLALAQARVHEAAGRNGEQRAVLAALARRADLDAEARAQVQDAQRELDLSDARTLARGGDTDRALALLDARLAAQPDDSRARRQRAGVLADAGRWPEARDAYAAELAHEPDNLDLRLDLAYALEQGGDTAGARREAQTVLQRAQPQDLEPRLAAARRLQALGYRDDARRALEALRAQQPGNAAVQAQSGWLARSDGRYGEAVEHFRAATQAAPVPDPQWQDAVRQIESRRQAWIRAGLDVEDKPGDPGISDTQTTLLPVELRWPRGYDGHWFALAEFVDLDVGRLPADYDEAALYGTVLAAGPDSVAARLPEGHDPGTDGIALGAGYQNDAWRIDLGTTPLGMPVQDVVGGLRYDAKWRAVNLTADLSRRPVTSSLLSFGGAKDPVSGRTWGGVRDNGLDLRAAHYGQRWSLSGTVTLARLDGRNVPDNDLFGLRGSIDYKLWEGAGQELFIGAAVRYSSHDQNQRFYSFGHGGYYSPQSYTVSSLPLEWRGRWGRFSYRFEGSVSQSRAREDDALFYPTDPALQAQALGSVLPPGFDAPVYEGGSGTGTGYSLRAAMEYRLDDRWALGGRAAIDRSDFYEPNFFTLYFRRMLLDTGREVLAVPPQVPQRYTDF